MKTKKVFLWTIVVLFAVGAVCLFLLWRYIYTPVSIGKMERFYKKHCVEMEQLAAYANRAVDDGAYLWLHLFPNGDEGLYIRARGTADTLRLGVHVLDSDSLLQAVGLTTPTAARRRYTTCMAAHSTNTSLATAYTTVR